MSSVSLTLWRPTDFAALINLSTSSGRRYSRERTSAFSEMSISDEVEVGQIVLGKLSHHPSQVALGFPTLKVEKVINRT
jgi:hypothetical protein